MKILEFFSKLGPNDFTTQNVLLQQKKKKWVLELKELRIGRRTDNIN